MIAACVTLVAVLVVGASPPPNGASPSVDGDAASQPTTDARTEAEHGEALFLEGRFDEAADAYGRAYALEPSPAFLFARARSEQEAHRCEQAIELYRAFIATDPPASDIDRANLEIGRCYGEIRTVEPPAPRVDPPAATPPPAPLAQVKPHERPPRAAWIRDPVGGGVFGAGLIVFAAGLGLFLAGDAADRRAGHAATTDDFRQLTDRARVLEGIGIAGISAGSALLVGGITRYAIVARRARRGRGR